MYRRAGLGAEGYKNIFLFPRLNPEPAQTNHRDWDLESKLVKTAHTRIITVVPVVTCNTINYLIDHSVSRFEVDGWYEITFLWDMTPFSVMSTYRCFREIWFIHSQGRLVMSGSRTTSLPPHLVQVRHFWLRGHPAIPLTWFITTGFSQVCVPNPLHSFLQGYNEH